MPFRHAGKNQHICIVLRFDTGDSKQFVPFGHGQRLISNTFVSFWHGGLETICAGQCRLGTGNSQHICVVLARGGSKQFVSFGHGKEPEPTHLCRFDTGTRRNLCRLDTVKSQHIRAVWARGIDTIFVVFFTRISSTLDPHLYFKRKVVGEGGGEGGRFRLRRHGAKASDPVTLTWANTLVFVVYVFL